jgi:pimeloyl-ACP methyl ester carboxylesterase
MAILAQNGFRVAVPDQRGYGESDKPSGIAAYRIDALTGDVVGLIRALGFERAHIVGHDWGGRVAWQLAIDHPEAVDRLAVIGMPHPEAAETVVSQEPTSSWHWTFFQLPWLPEWSARVANWRVPSSLLRGSSLSGTFPEEKLDLYRSAWAKEGAFHAMLNWYRAAYWYPPSSAAPRRVSRPALMLIAPDDPFLASDVARASVRFIEDGRVVDLVSGTHWVAQEDPETVTRILADFFRE